MSSWNVPNSFIMIGISKRVGGTGRKMEIGKPHREWFHPRNKLCRSTSSRILLHQPSKMYFSARSHRRIPCVPCWPRISELLTRGKPSNINHVTLSLRLAGWQPLKLPKHYFTVQRMLTNNLNLTNQIAALTPFRNFPTQLPHSKIPKFSPYATPANTSPCGSKARISCNAIWSD